MGYKFEKEHLIKWVFGTSGLYRCLRLQAQEVERGQPLGTRSVREVPDGFLYGDWATNSISVLMGMKDLFTNEILQRLQG